MGYKHWTLAEEEYLLSCYGSVMINNVCRKLKRDVKKVETKARRMGLGGIKDNYLNPSQIAELFGIDHKCISETWVKRGLKFDKRSDMKKTSSYTTLDNLLRFLKANQDIFDSRKLEINALGIEPKWLKEKRVRDKERPAREKKVWSYYEEQELIRLYKQKMRAEDIGKMLNRSKSSIHRKVSRLSEAGILEKEQYTVPFTTKEDEFIIEMKKELKTHKWIAEELGRAPHDIACRLSKLKKKGLYVAQK